MNGPPVELLHHLEAAVSVGTTSHRVEYDGHAVHALACEWCGSFGIVSSYRYSVGSYLELGATGFVHYLTDSKPALSTSLMGAVRLRSPRLPNDQDTDDVTMFLDLGLGFWRLDGHVGNATWHAVLPVGQVSVGGFTGARHERGLLFQGVLAVGSSDAHATSVSDSALAGRFAGPTLAISFRAEGGFRFSL